MGSDESGMPVPTFKNSSGTYHMSGCLEVAPEAFPQPSPLRAGSCRCGHYHLYASSPALCEEALLQQRGIHMVNWPEDDFNDILRSGSEACSNAIKTEGEKLGLTIAAFNPLSCFGQADDLADIKSSVGLAIWREDDSVHLTAAVYGDIATVISNQAKTNGRQNLAALARRRQASVVPAPGEARPAAREPDWISCQLRPARGSQRGGQHAGYK